MMLTKLEEDILSMAPFQLKAACAKTGMTVLNLLPVIEGMERKGLLSYCWKTGALAEWRLTDKGDD